MRLTSQNSALTLFFLLGAVGVGMRTIGLYDHVTYVDETLVLSEGEWNPETSVMKTSEGAWSYAWRTAMNPKCSYAPLQLALSYALAAPSLLSPTSLHRSRLPSWFFSCLALLLFGSLCWTSGDRSLGLVVFALFCVHPALVLNAKQNHPYSAGVAGATALIFCARWVWWRRTWSGIGGFLLLPVFALCYGLQYQLIPVGAAFLLAVGLLWVGDWWSGAIPTSIVLRRFLTVVPLVFLTALSAWVVTRLKGGMGIAWWVSAYAFDRPPVGELLRHPAGLLPLVQTSARSVRDLLAFLHQTAFDQDLTALWPGFAVLIGAGGWSVLKERRRDTLFAALVLLIFVYLYLRVRVPLAPSRHSLILIPFVLWLELAGLTALCRTAAIRRTVSVVFLAVILGFSLLAFPRTLSASRETWDADVVRSLVEKYDVQSIGAGAFEQGKARVFFSAGPVPFFTYHSVDTLPHQRLLIVAQNPTLGGGLGSAFPGDLSSGRFRAKLVFRRQAAYDFEPAPQIHYWPNEFFVWLLEPISPSVGEVPTP